jgi:clumping factor A
MTVFSLVLILVAVALLVLGLTGGASTLLIASIVTSLLAAIALVIGARRVAATRRPTPTGAEPGESARMGYDNRHAGPADSDFAPADPGYGDALPTPADFDGWPAPANFPGWPAPADFDGSPARVDFDSGPVPADFDDGPAPADVDGGPVPADVDGGPVPADVDGRPAPADFDGGAADPAEFDHQPVDRVGYPSPHADSAGPDHAEAAAFAAGWRDTDESLRDADDLGETPGAPRREPIWADEPAPGPGAPEQSAGATLPAADLDADPADPEPDPDDPEDEPRPQAVQPADAVRVARMQDDVVVVDGRPRYHMSDCRTLGGRTVEALPVAEAVALGFSPCGRCRPVDRLVAAAAARP